MKDDMLKNYLLIGRVQNAISKAENLQEALVSSVQAILDGSSAKWAVAWTIEEDSIGDSAEAPASADDAAEAPTSAGDSAEAPATHFIRPSYWICPNDLTSITHTMGDGFVGSVCETQQSVRLLQPSEADKQQLTTDFEGLTIASMVCVALTDGADTIGCIQILSDENEFSEEEADTFEIMAMMASMALKESDLIPFKWEPKKVILKARGITRSFQNGDEISHILNGVNLDVYEGEFLAVLGESGCGKSTFLNIIGGMDQPDSGEWYYESKELSNATQNELTDYRRDNIGFIFQSYNLMPNLNASQNLDLIGELVEDPLPSEEALNMVGLGQRTTNYPSQLSGGQQQRVSIARALVKKPRVIFADEPTAALDYETSIEVLQVLEEVVKTGTTLVMVTHNEEITRMADRVVRMRHGQVYEITINKHPAKATDLVW